MGLGERNETIYELKLCKERQATQDEEKQNMLASRLDHQHKDNIASPWIKHPACWDMLGNEFNSFLLGKHNSLWDTISLINSVKAPRKKRKRVRIPIRGACDRLMSDCFNWKLIMMKTAFYRGKTVSTWVCSFDHFCLDERGEGARLVLIKLVIHVRRHEGREKPN